MGGNQEKQMNVSHMRVYLWLMNFLAPYRWMFAATLLFGVLITGVELLVPKAIQLFIDDIVPRKDFKKFGVTIAALAVLLAGKIVLGTVKTIWERRVQEQAARDLQIALFGQLRRLGFAYFEKTPIGQSLSLMNKEVTAAQDVYRRYMPWMLQGIIFSILSIVLMMSTNLLLSSVIIPSFLLYYLVGPYFEKKAAQFGKQMATDSLALNQKVYESVASLLEMRAFSREKWSNARALKGVETHNASMITTYLYAYLRGTVRRLIYYVGAMLLFVWGSHLVKTQQLTIGEFVAFLLYYFTAMHQITSVVTTLTEQKVLMFQISRLYEFMGWQPAVREADGPVMLPQVKGNVTFRDVFFRYPDGPQPLRGFSLEVSAGKRVGIVGTSGNGKSTLLKLLARFYEPDAGEILLDDVPISQLSLQQLRESIGFVFQETYLFGASIRENIRFGHPEATDEQVVEAAKRAYAHDFITELPQGYDTPVGERGMKLSGGQKQRIAIARMMVKDPQIILLDEATSALDTVSERHVQEALHTFLAGRTTFTVAHRLSTVQEYDTILVLDQGSIAEMGTYEELMRKKGLFFMLVRGQLEEGAVYA